MNKLVMRFFPDRWEAEALTMSECSHQNWYGKGSGTDIGHTKSERNWFINVQMHGTPILLIFTKSQVAWLISLAHQQRKIKTM